MEATLKVKYARATTQTGLGLGSLVLFFALLWGLTAGSAAGAADEGADLLTAGLEALAEGDFAAAAHFKQAVAADPQNPLPYLYLGEVCRHQNAEEEAARHYEQFFALAQTIEEEHGPVLDEAGEWLFGYYEQQHQNERAEAVLRRLVELRPHYLEHRWTLARWLMIKENYEEAARQYQMVLPLVTSPQQLESALSEWTETLTKTGQVEEETKALEAAVEQPTADPWCHVQLLKLYQVAGRTGDAARLVERLAAADLAWPAKEKVFRWAHQVVLSFTEPHEFVPAYERAFAGVDDSIQSHLWRADLYERLGQEEQVVAALEKARTMEPENTPILQRLGAAYERLGQPEQARDVYQSWLRLDRHNVGVRLSLARTLVALGKPEEAYAVLPMPEEFKIQSLLDYGPGHKARTRREYLAQYAQRIRELGLLERAIADYEKEAAARPEEAVFPALLNFLYLEADTPEKAVEPLLKSLIQRGPVSHWDEFELLWPRWEKEGREETALRLLERMVFDPQVGEYPRGNYIDKLVALYRRLEQIPAGVQRVQQALTAAPGDRVLLRLLAQLEQLQGKRGAALEVQEELADRHPDDPQSYVELGRAYRQAGRLNEAIAAWEKAVELQPKNGAAWERLGAAYAQADRVEDTIRAYEEALKVVPLKHLARARISEALTQLQAHRGRRAPDLEALLMEVDQQPDDYRRRLAAGAALLAAGQREEALRQYVEAVRLAPNTPVERKVLAQHFMQQRLPDLAAAECLRLIAASREVYQAFVDLNQLLADRSFDPAIGDALVTAVEKVSPEAPEAPRLRVLRPLIYAAARRPQEAVQTWLAVRDQEEAQPLTKHFLPTLFGTCQRTGTTQAAQDTLAAAATLAEAPDILIHWYAEWLERVGNKAAAIAQYERLRERAPAGAQTRRRLAQLYAETDREAEALAMYEQLLAEQPTDLGLHEAAARAHERFGRWEQARALYEKGLALAQSAEAKQRLQDEIARLQAADGSPEERLAALQAAREKDPRNGKRYELLGDFYLEQDNIPAAAEAYDRAMELYFAAGQSRDLFYDRKMALRAAGRWETAVAFYQAAIDRGRVKRIDPFMLAGNETLRAQADVTLEKFAAAQQRLIAAQPAGDQAAEAWLAIAEAYGSPGLDGAKHGSLALAACDSARESAQRPELKIQAQERAAQVAQQVLHDPLEEEARYRALIEAFPERYEAIRAQFALARLYERQGDLKAAESIYEEVLARPDKQYAAAARVALGQVLLPQGEREEALALLRSVVKESRDPTVMREAQRLIAGVEGLVVTFCYRTTETFAVHTRDVRSGDPATAAVETVVAYECAAMDKRRVTATLTLQTARELNPAAPEFQQARFSEAEGRTSIVWTDELWTKPLTLQGTSFWSRCLVSAPQTDARVPGAFTLGRRFELRENGRGTATLRLTLEGNQGLTALVHESEEVHLDTDTFSPRPDQIQPGERRCFLFFLRASHRRPQEIQFDVLLPEGRNVYYPRVTVLLDRQYYELPSVRDPVQRYESAAGDDKAILELAEPFFIEKAWGETFRQVVVQEIVE